MKKKIIFILVVFTIMLSSTNVNAVSIKELDLNKIKEVGLTSKIDTYNSAQSIVVTDKYLVVMLTDTNNDNKNALYVYKNNNGVFSYYKVFKNRHYGHGNDMTYNSKTNEIAVINDNKVEILNASNFKEKKSIWLSKNYTNISYDSNDNVYYLGKSDIGLDKYNSNFKIIGNIINSNNYRGNQGVSEYKNNIYVCNYIFDGTLSDYSSYGKFNLKESLIFKYNKKNKLGKIYHIDSKYKELEGISFWNDTAYLLFQRGGTFKVYTTTNMTLNAADNVYGELSDIEGSIISNENQDNTNYFIENLEEIIKSNDTPQDVNSDTVIEEVPSNTTDTTDDVAVIPDNAIVNNTPVVENSTISQEDTTVEEVKEESNVDVSEENNVDNYGNDNQVSSDDNTDIEEVVVEVPDTKKNNTYLLIIGILTIMFGIVFEKNLTNKLYCGKITSK